MTTLADNLIAARKMIEKPENWCQRRLCVRKRNRQMTPLAYCSLGAINQLYEEFDLSIEDFESMIKAIEAVVGAGIVKFNDTHTHSEVLAAFDRAIEQARKQ